LPCGRCRPTRWTRCPLATPPATTSKIALSARSCSVATQTPIRCFFGAYYREPRSWRGRTRDRVRRQRDRGTRPAAGGGAAAYFADPRGAAHGRRDLRHLRGAARSAPRPGPGRRAARQDINSGRRRCRTALPADRETPTWQSPSRAESGSPAIGSNWSGCVSSRRLRARRRSHLLHAPPP